MSMRRTGTNCLVYLLRRLNLYRVGCPAVRDQQAYSRWISQAKEGQVKDIRFVAFLKVLSREVESLDLEFAQFLKGLAETR